MRNFEVKVSFMDLYFQNSCLGSPCLFPEEMFTMCRIVTDGHWPLLANE